MSCDLGNNRWDQIYRVTWSLLEELSRCMMCLTWSVIQNDEGEPFYHRKNIREGTRAGAPRRKQDEEKYGQNCIPHDADERLSAWTTESLKVWPNSVRSVDRCTRYELRGKQVDRGTWQEG